MQCFPGMPSQSGLLGHRNDARDVLTSLLEPVVPNDLTNFCNL